MTSIVNFRLCDTVACHTTHKLESMLCTTMRYPKNGTTINQTLFFGINRIEAEIDHRGFVRSAIQLRNQHNILLCALTTDIYNFKTNKIVPLAIKGIYSAIQLHDDRLVLGFSRRIEIRDPHTFKLLNKYDVFGSTSHIKLAVIDKSLIACGLDYETQVWDTNTMKHISTFASDQRITCVLALTNSMLAVASSCDIIIWNVHNNTSMQTLEGHTSQVWGLLQVGSKLVSSSSDKTLRFWNFISGQCEKVCQVDGSITYSLALHHEGYIIGLGDQTFFHKDDTGIEFVQEPRMRGTRCVVSPVEYYHTFDL